MKPNEFEFKVHNNASGDEAHWDEPEAMDAQTNYLLSYAGMQCRVIGTFFFDCDDPDKFPKYRVVFW